MNASAFLRLYHRMILSFILLMRCITLIDLCMSNHPCIQGKFNLAVVDSPFILLLKAVCSNFWILHHCY